MNVVRIDVRSRQVRDRRHIKVESKKNIEWADGLGCGEKLGKASSESQIE